MKIAIIGGYGQFGIEIGIASDERGYHVKKLLREEIISHSFDYIRDFDIIINCAAFHKPLEKCESEFQTAINTNVILPKYISEYCAQTGKIYIQISTDHVYGENDLAHLNHEAIKKTPFGAYALTKSWGEDVVEANYRRYNSNRYYIFRVATLHGRLGNNFLETVYKKLRNGESVEIPISQKANFTNAYQAAHMILDVIERCNFKMNIFNCANSGFTSFFQYAHYAMERRNVNISKLSFTTVFEDKIRPIFSAMNLNRISCYTNLIPFEKGIEDYNTLMEF